MKELLIKLNQLTDITLYVCSLREKKMSTVHDGAIFEADTPPWMHSFVTGDKMTLVFEQRGQRKQYYRWKIDDDTHVVILDDTQHNVINLILNRLLANLGTHAGQGGIMPPDPSAQDNRVYQEKLTQTLSMLDEERKARIAEKDVFAGLENQVKLLKEQNLDQANRLKDTLAKNLDLSHQLKQIQVESQTGISRNNATLLKEENGRLISQIQDLEERFEKLTSRYNEIVKNPPDPAPPMGQPFQPYAQGQEMMPFPPQDVGAYTPQTGEFQGQFSQMPGYAPGQYPIQGGELPPQGYAPQGQYPAGQFENSYQQYAPQDMGQYQQIPPQNYAQPEAQSYGGTPAYKPVELEGYTPAQYAAPQTAPVQPPTGMMVSAQPTPPTIDLNFEMPSNARQMMQNSPQAQQVPAATYTPPPATPQAPQAKGLIDVITALNNVIATRDASGINLDKLGQFVTLPPKEQLERNPSAIKAIIAKLSGLERTGQLAPAQIKALCEIIK